MKQEAILAALRDNLPFADLTGVRVAYVLDDPREKGPLDVRVVLSHGDTRVEVFGEVKNACTPKLVKEIAPWLAGMKAVRPDAAFALICPALSDEAQAVCAQHHIDFIDLAGNVSINVPGKLYIRQRVPVRGRIASRPAGFLDPFAGKASRVLRVLLERPGAWKLTQVAEELEAEGQRNQLGKRKFSISLGSISKTLRSLQEQLLVRRRGSQLILAEPERLLLRWAETYAARSRGYLRGSLTLPNLFGNDLGAVAQSLRKEAPCASFAFTGAAAAAARAPLADLDVIEVFADTVAAARFFSMAPDSPSYAARLRVLQPYDAGVFMYGQIVGELPLVSDLQIYLDLFARGGRDIKQAEYLFQKVIRARWGPP